jgi:hypothetical protein
MGAAARPSTLTIVHTRNNSVSVPMLPATATKPSAE